VPTLPRVLYLGTAGASSLAPLLALLEAGVPICAVAVGAGSTNPRGPVPVRHLLPAPAETGGLPLRDPYATRGIVQLAWDHCIPVLELEQPGATGAREALAAMRPDMICAACFPSILPPTILDLPAHGCLNVHPSLLPAYRGPAPLFWQFRYGESRGGVTIHWMDRGIDSGDIAAQESVPIPEGIRGQRLAQACAEVGARLLVDVVRQVAAGSSARHPQAAGAGSYQSWPGPDDYLVEATESARRAFNFIRGVASWRPPMIRAAEETFPVADALDYDPEMVLGRPFSRRGGELLVQFSPGVLRARL
jgi:methionyl-tRNA formyltransferase